MGNLPIKGNPQSPRMFALSGRIIIIMNRSSHIQYAMLMACEYPESMLFEMEVVLQKTGRRMLPFDSGH